jgi:hypothetical protein
MQAPNQATAESAEIPPRTAATTEVSAKKIALSDISLAALVAQFGDGVAPGASDDTTRSERRLRSDGRLGGAIAVPAAAAGGRACSRVVQPAADRFV